MVTAGFDDEFCDEFGTAFGGVAFGSTRALSGFGMATGSGSGMTADGGGATSDGGSPAAGWETIAAAAGWSGGFVAAGAGGAGAMIVAAGM